MSPSKIPKPLVLLAEDNPVVRKGVENFLTKWGYETIAADNGDQAWELLEADPAIRLAIIDWNLPGISGIQLCQRLRTRTGPYVYAIMFSARKSHEEKLMALDGGADDYLVKPCKPSELRARLGVGRRIIDNALSLRESTPPVPAPETENSPPAPADNDETSTTKK
ncbi:MAG TPA: response regulator transcription factor [Desulfobacterales bacterium]|nr:response regulator transcription factor [Desulfobacterales bacterium]